jgi:hypothetical protein
MVLGMQPTFSVPQQSSSVNHGTNCGKGWGRWAQEVTKDPMHCPLTFVRALPQYVGQLCSPVVSGLKNDRLANVAFLLA